MIFMCVYEHVCRSHYLLFATAAPPDITKSFFFGLLRTKNKAEAATAQTQANMAMTIMAAFIQPSSSVQNF